MHYRTLFSAVLIAACAGALPANAAESAKPTSSPPASTHFNIVPIYRVRPVYPRQALKQFTRGCVLVAFHLDRHSRPTRIQVRASVPNGAFDRAAIQAIAKWRFRVTDSQGRPAAYTQGILTQEITFSFDSGSIRGERANSIINWMCLQPPPATLVAAPAPATAKLSIPAQKYGLPAQVVKIPDPHNEPLKSGWVDVDFCVDKNGAVSDASVRKSSPRHFYNQAALAALKSWPFSPRMRYRQPAKTCGLSYRINIIGQADLATGPAVIDRRPTAVRVDDLSLPSSPRPQHGKVTLSFCIDRDGSISNAKAISSRPRSVFDKAAKQILQLWQYWPQTVRGTPMRTCGIQQTVVFKLGHGKLVWAYPAKS